MKRIILLHTVKSVYDNFSTHLPVAVPSGTIIDHVVDEYLANDAARKGGLFSKDNLMRLFSIMMNIQFTNPDIIVVTCSTLSPYIDRMREFITTPIIAIDDAMCENAVVVGNRICVLATASSALDPTIHKIKNIALKEQKEIEIDGYCDPEAINALKKGNKELHDTLLLNLAKNGRGYDVIVLSQASMAHMTDRIEAFTTVRTLSSFDLCIDSIVKALGE